MQLISSSYDIIFFGIIIASSVFALIRGGASEILSISSWFIALWFMHTCGKQVNKIIPNSIDNTLLRSIIVYFMIFIVVAVAISIIKKVFANIITKLGLTGLNYLIGLVFGVIRGIFICAIIIIIIEILNLDINHDWRNAKAYLIINPAIRLIVNSIPENIKKLPPPNFF